MSDNTLTTTPPTVRAARIRAAYARTECGRQEWIEGTLELAAELKEARKICFSDMAFSVWLSENELHVVNDQDRAALIAYADDLLTARQVLEETRRTSWQLIWREEMKARFASASKPEPTALSSVETPEPAAISDVFPEPPAEKIKISTSRKILLKTHPFFGLERGQEIAEIYQDKYTRKLIGKKSKARGGRKLWSRILDAYDVGFVKPNGLCLRFKLNPRLLIPGAPKGFGAGYDLGKPADLTRFDTEVWLDVEACREAIIAAPERTKEIVGEHRRTRTETKRAALFQQRTQAAISTMLGDQQEVVMFGVQLWPRVDNRYGEYDYDQLCTAVWTFSDLNGWLQCTTDNAAGSRAIQIRQSVFWYRKHVDRSCPIELRGKIKRVYQLMDTLAGLLEKHPDDAGNKTPPTPKVEGKR